MKALSLVAVSLALMMLVPPPAAAGSSGRIYGRVTTIDGDEYEGLIRWDKNEASWIDILHGNKELRGGKEKGRRTRRGGRGERLIKIFGLTITRSGDYYGSGAAQSGVCFGHIKSLEVLDDESALVTLKSGGTVELESGSTDVGESLRGLVIEEAGGGEIELEWEDIERIDFMQGPSGLASKFGERLYGTMTTRDGDEYTGWVCWDVDELFGRDVLDGKEKSRKRNIKFEKIKSIERRSSSAAGVTLSDGDVIKLRGTNDVNNSNRGIVIAVENFGQVMVGWDNFERLDLLPPPEPVTYGAFDGGRQMEGTVYTEDGGKYTGRIRWDDDEEYTWEILDGEFRDAEFDIEFGNIQRIERKGSHSAIVTVWNGPTIRLRGTNDVNDENKGIFIERDNGEEVEVDWDEFERVEFLER